MAVETKYICDRCGAVSDTSDQMWNVGITCDSWPGRTTYGTPRMVRLWCRACAETFALVSNKQVLPEQVRQVTLEELIREIAREEAGSDRDGR